jgi:hypothetical protein
MENSAGDSSPTLSGFSEAHNLVFFFFFFTNSSRWKRASSLNHRQSKVAGYGYMNCKLAANS